MPGVHVRIFDNSTQGRNKTKWEDLESYEKGESLQGPTLHNVHFGYYVYLPTEQAETYLKSWSP